METTACVYRKVGFRYTALKELSAALPRHCRKDRLSPRACLEPYDTTTLFPQNHLSVTGLASAGRAVPWRRPQQLHTPPPLADLPPPRWRVPPSPQRCRPPPPARARAAQARARRGGAGGREPRSPPAGRGRGARTHVSPWTTRRLPGSCCIPLSHWLSCEPFTFYPAFAANHLAPFIASGCGACELRRVEFSERACVAGVGRPPLVWVGGVGEVLRLRRAGSAGGREGEEAVPGPGEWRNLTVGGSEAAAGKWRRRRRRRHNETRPVVGGSAGLGPVRAGRRWRPGRACPSPWELHGGRARVPEPAARASLSSRSAGAAERGGMAAVAPSPPSRRRGPVRSAPPPSPRPSPSPRVPGPPAPTSGPRDRPRQLPAGPDAGRGRGPACGAAAGPARRGPHTGPSRLCLLWLRAPRAAALGACRGGCSEGRRSAPQGWASLEPCCRVAGGWGKAA